ncbi:MAG: hypothetical protein OXG16_12720 [Rhodospirillales bacterium]|nr:hypothetical protein [Rhodospirillales bacterium]
MASPEITEYLLEVCGSINDLATEKERLIRQIQERDTKSFQNVEEVISTVFWLAEETPKVPVNMVPSGALSRAAQSLSRTKMCLDRISQFSDETKSSERHVQVLSELEDSVEHAMRDFGEWLPLLALRSGNIENLAARTKAINAEATTILQDAQRQAGIELQELEEIKRAAREAAGEAGAAEFTREFRDEARAATIRAWWWLGVTGILAMAALTMPVLIIFGEFGKPPTDVWEAAYMTGWRVIAIAVLFYAATWTGRVVLAHMNLSSVNKHRGISLQTLQAFHRAADDPAAKDAVVLEAARAVYENVPTGYIARPSAQQGGGARTLELIKNASRSSPESGGA